MWDTLPLELKRGVLEHLITRKECKRYCLVNWEWFHEVMQIHTREYGANEMLRRWCEGLLEMDRLNSSYVCNLRHLHLCIANYRYVLPALQSGLGLPSVCHLEYDEEITWGGNRSDCLLLACKSAPMLQTLYIHIFNSSIDSIRRFVRSFDTLAAQFNNPPPVIRLRVATMSMLRVVGGEPKARRLFSVVKAIRCGPYMETNASHVVASYNVEIFKRFESLERIDIEGRLADDDDDDDNNNNINNNGPGLGSMVGFRFPDFTPISCLKSLKLNSRNKFTKPKLFVSMLSSVRCQLEFLDLEFVVGSVEVLLDEFARQQIHLSQLHTLILYEKAGRSGLTYPKKNDPIKMLRQLDLLLSENLSRLDFGVGLMIDTAEESRLFWKEFCTRWTKFASLKALRLCFDVAFEFYTPHDPYQFALPAIGLTMPNLRTLHLLTSGGKTLQSVYSFPDELDKTAPGRPLFPELEYFAGMHKRWFSGFLNNTKKCFWQFFRHHFPRLHWDPERMKCLHCQS